VGVALAVIVGGLAAGCDEPPPGPDPGGSTPSAGASARFSRLMGDCPTLTGETAKRFGAAGQGRSTGPATSPVPGAIQFHCGWSGRDARPSVRAVVSIHPNGFPPESGDGNARRLFESLRDDAAAGDAASTVVRAQTTEWGPAFVVANSSLDTVTQNTLAANVVITVVVNDLERFSGDMSAERDDLLRRLGPAALTLTGEVIDDLR
jgi:hypothetical protein